MGLQVKNQDEQELHRLRRLSFIRSETLSEKDVDIHSFDPSFYSVQLKTASTPKARKSWLPPLNLEIASNLNHPALQSTSSSPTLADSQINLLPAPIDREHLLPSLPTTMGGQSSISRSQTVTTSSSSFYSRPTSGSTLSRLPSSCTSFSNEISGNVHHGSPFIEGSRAIKSDSKSISTKHRRTSHTPRASGTPVRPRSRPPMPPANFWIFARAEQQKRDTMIENTLYSEPPGAASEQRSRSHSDGSSKREVSMSRYPIIPAAPPKAVLRPNHNAGNMMRVGKRWSYENLRKGLKSAAALEYSLFDENFARKTEGRTLIKKRQPWDDEPRKERRTS